MKEWQKLGKHSGKESIGNEKAHIGDRWAQADESKTRGKLVARHRKANGWHNVSNERVMLISEHDGVILYW